MIIRQKCQVETSQNDKGQDNPPDMPEGESMERQEAEEISLNNITF